MKVLNMLTLKIDFLQNHFSYIQAEFAGLAKSWVVCNFGGIKFNTLMCFIILQVPDLVILILTPCRPSRAFLFDLQKNM